MIFNSQFDIGEFVYMIHDPNQIKWMVTQVSFRRSSVSYELLSGTTQAYAMEYELSTDENTVLKVTS